MASFTTSSQLVAVKELLSSLQQELQVVPTTPTPSPSSLFAQGPVSFQAASDSDAGVGIFANENVSKGTLLLQVPFDKCLTTERVVQCTALRQLFDDQQQLLTFAYEVLAIGLMFGLLCLEKFEAIVDSDERKIAEQTAVTDVCPFLLHIKTIPRTFNTTLYWHDDELLELKGCMTFHLTQLMKRQIDKDWESIHSQLAEAYPDVLGGATKEIYMWALSVIYSRAVGISRQGIPLRIIPPVIDMANHDPSFDPTAETADTFDFDEAQDLLKFVAGCDREAKQECCAIYGHYPNSKLAYTYGFVLHPNPHQAIDLWTRLPQTSFAAEHKRRVLDQHTLTANQTYDFTGTLRKLRGEGASVSAALLAMIRVIQVGNEEELAQVENAYKGQIISVRNETATYASLRALLMARMDVERAESDKKRLGELLLDGASLGSREVMALVIRVEERELVGECLRLINEWSAELLERGDLYVPPDSSS